MSARDRCDWFWSDWLGDIAVRRLTPAERGIWIDLIGLAWSGTPFGFVTDARGEPVSFDEIARLTGVRRKDELKKLINGVINKGAASRDGHGRIYCRRMLRDAEISRKKAAQGALGGRATKEKWQRFQGDFNFLPGVPPQQPGNPSPYRDITKTSSVAARAKQEDQSEGGPATALPSGAPALTPVGVAKRAANGSADLRPSPELQKFMAEKLGLGRAAE